MKTRRTLLQRKTVRWFLEGRREKETHQHDRSLTGSTGERLMLCRKREAENRRRRSTNVRTSRRRRREAHCANWTDLAKNARREPQSTEEEGGKTGGSNRRVNRSVDPRHQTRCYRETFHRRRTADTALHLALNRRLHQHSRNVRHVHVHRRRRQAHRRRQSSLSPLRRQQSELLTDLQKPPDDDSNNPATCQRGGEEKNEVVGVTITPTCALRARKV